MQKTTHVVKKSEVKLKEVQTLEVENVQPSELTLKKIMQFASSYRAQKLSDNQYVDLILN